MTLKLVPPPPERDPAFIAARAALDASEVGRAFAAAHRELRAAEDDLRAAKARVAAAKTAFFEARDAWQASPEAPTVQLRVRDRTVVTVTTVAGQVARRERARWVA